MKLRAGTSAYLNYIYLDVENFTVNRTVEAQADIVNSLNRLVLEALETNTIEQGEYIAMSTGDGLCLAINKVDPYDLIINVSTCILEKIHILNESQPDTSRQFNVKIGLNQNTDNIIEDINGNLNVAGRGVNLSQRIMSLGDGGNIFVSDSVYEVFREREKYKDSFRKISTSDKHGNSITAHLLASKDILGLNSDLPERHRRYYFEQPLTEYQAHFIANAIFWGEYLLRHTNKNGLSLCILHMMTKDTLGQIHDTKHKKSVQRVEFDDRGLPRPYIQKVVETETWIIHELSNEIQKLLVDACHSFEDSDSFSIIPSPSVKGKIKLLEEYLHVWEFVRVKYDLIAATMKPLELQELKAQLPES